MSLNYKAIKCLTETEWQEARKISGTRASAILGQNPNFTNVDVWEILTNKKKDKDISDNDYVQFGLNAENHIRALFRLEVANEYEVVDPTDRVVYVHNEKPYLTASVDGLLIRKADNALGVLEIKTTRSTKEWLNGIPQHYYIQFLHEIMVLNADFGVLVAYLRYKDYSLIKQYFISRDEKAEDIKRVYEQEVQFYEDYVLSNQKPPLAINI